MLAKKVILTGSFGVGKTSLFNRFISNVFDEKYLTTIGVKVDKKVMRIDGEDITLILWDIAGEVNQNKVPSSYFLGTSAILYVFDLTRPSTFANLSKDLRFLRKMLPGCIIKVIGNKSDLLDASQIQDISKQVSQLDAVSSAKTGAYVEEIFEDLCRRLLNNSVHNGV